MMYTHFDETVNVDRIISMRRYSFNNGRKMLYQLFIYFSSDHNVQWNFPSEEERDNVFNDIFNLHNKSTIST